MKIDELGVAVLDCQTGEYEQLRRFFLERGKDVPPTWLRWDEQREAVYSRKELEHYELLEISIIADAGLGGNTYAKVYDVSVCEACGRVTIHRQLRDLVADLSRVTKDLASTRNFYESLVSTRLRGVLEEVGAEGVEFRPVEHARPSRPPRRGYYQLIVHNVMGPLLAPRSSWMKRCSSCGWESDKKDKGTEEPDPWTKIRWWDPGPWNELHFPRVGYQGWSLARTAEMFGGPLSPADPGPEFPKLLISQQLYRLLRHHKITGYAVRPAHLD